MLEDCLFESRSSVRSKKPATLALSVFVHGAIVGGLILIPLFQTQVLPQVPVFEPLLPPVVRVRTVELMPASGGGPPSGGKPNVVQEPPALKEPQWIPKTIAIVEDDGQLSLVGPRPSPGDSVGGPITGLGPSIGGPGFGPGPAGPPAPPPAAPPPPPPPVPEPAPTGPVRVGGVVIQSNLIKTVQPVYPRLAAISRVQGAVILEAIITREGTISNLRVISGHGLLVDAAIDAVKQWRYRPTLLNGAPVEVITTVTVNFTLK